jgi:hypothetical protein
MGEEARGQVPTTMQAPHTPRRNFIGDIAVLRLSLQAKGLLDSIVNLTDDEPDDIFRKAISLYKVALEAHAQGKAVGVAASADSLETEFVGF